MSSQPHAVLAAFLIASLLSPFVCGAEETNHDEAKVGTFELPDALVMRNGQAVKDAAGWPERRDELLELFRTQVYGRRLPEPQRLQFHVTEDTPEPLAGVAKRKRVRIALPDSKTNWGGIKLTLFVPTKAARPVPAFVGMHLFDAASDDPVPGKLLTDQVDDKLPGAGILRVILERGYAIGTLDAKDFCADDAATFREGLLAHYAPDRSGPLGAEEGGAIAAWAWGLSRALDYLETDRDIDARRVTVIGHSRMGKTALWAGAQDERFAIVISNNSGCGGAALSRRNYGETVEAITRRFPHWFCANFSNYAGHENDLPVDQHELIGLVAPRPVYVASAVEDRWADPRGEFLAAAGADPVYTLLGKQGLQATRDPPVGQSIGDAIGYHLRVGKHALTDYDWLRYLNFADRHFGKPAKTSP